MSTINLLFYINFYVFAIFAVLLITELMGSVLLLLFWDKAKTRVLEYIVPIWEVTGTFGAFWVVITDFAFPAILIPAAKLYAVALMLFLILFIARNSSISFGEYIIKKGWMDHKKLYQMYALSTLVLGIVALTIFSSIIGGKGIDIGAGYFSISAWLQSPGSALFIIGALVIGVGLAPVFYGLDPFRKIVLPVTAAGVAISLVSFYLYLPSLITPMLAVPAILTILVAILFLNDSTARIVKNKLIFAVVATVILFTLNPLVYPLAFGRSISVDSLTTTGPMYGAFLIITLVGGIILGIMIYVYLIAVRRTSRKKVPSA